MTHSVSDLAVRRMSAGLAAAALTAFIFIATDARAADDHSVSMGPTVTVKYSPDELDTAAGAANVYRKLNKAARSACGIDGGFLNLSEKTRAMKCVNETLANAVRKIDRPLLTSVHASKAGKVG